MTTSTPLTREQRLVAALQALVDAMNDSIPALDGGSYRYCRVRRLCSARREGNTMTRPNVYETALIMLIEAIDAQTADDGNGHGYIKLDWIAPELDEARSLLGV